MAHEPVDGCDCYHCNDGRNRAALHKAQVDSQKRWAAERAKNLAFPAEFIERHGGKEATVKLNIAAPDGTGLGSMAVFPDGAFCHPCGQMAFKEDFNTPEEKAWQAALVMAYCKAKVQAGTAEFTRRKEALQMNRHPTDEAIAWLEAFADRIKAWKRKAKVAEIMHRRALDRARYPGLSLSEIRERKQAEREAQERFEAAQAQYQAQQWQRIEAVNLSLEDAPQEETEAIATE